MICPQEVDWLDQNLSPRLDAGSGPVLAVDVRPSQPESVLDIPEFSIQVQNRRKNTQKRYESLPERSRTDCKETWLFKRFGSI